MGKVSKSTRKFQKNNLKKTIDQRHKVQKHNQKIQQGKKRNSSKKTGDNIKKTNDTEDVLKGIDFEEKGVKLPKSSSSNKDDKLKHKEDMGKLQEVDNEFYKYLKENDPGLLDFEAESSDEEEEEGESEDEDVSISESEQGEDHGEDQEEEDDEEAEAAPESLVVTLKDVKAWKKQLVENKSLTALKKILKAFSAAIHYSQDDDVSKLKYAVTDAGVFSALLVTTLSHTPDVVKHHIPLNKDNMPTENKKFRTISSALRGYGNSLNSVLQGNHDAATVQLILKSAAETLAYFLSHRKVVKNLINNVVDIFSTTADDEVRLASFGFLQYVAVTYQKSMLENILKATYSGLVRSSRRTTIHTMPAVNMQKNLIATLYDIDQTVSYQNGFQFVRQLAVHLRSSIVNKTADSYKAIYNWQYMHSLDFWSRVLSSQCDVSEEVSGKASPMRELIHPLVQVTLGTMRLIPTPQYFPLRFYLVRSLIRLSQQTGVYIPLAPVLTEILTSTTITKKPSPSKLIALDFEHNIRAAKSYLGTKVYQDGVCDQFIELLSEFYALHCKSVAFPELCIPVIITLKRFSKRGQNASFNKKINEFVARLEQNSKYIEAEREKADFGPTNRPKVDAFLKEVDWATTPLGYYVTTKREVREQLVRELRESAREEIVEDDEADEDMAELEDEASEEEELSEDDE